MYKGYISAFIDILFPKTCHICAKDIKDKTTAFDDYICASCADRMRRMPLVLCSLCAEKLTNEDELKNRKCGPCAKTEHSYDALISCYAYDGAAKELIHIYKYSNRPYLAKSMNKLIQKSLTQTDKAVCRKADAVTAVPLHPARLREREFNQSELLAREICSSLGKTFVTALKRTRNTQPQVRLKKNERSGNLAGAFTACHTETIKGKHILLVDDVVTTTSTIKEAAGTLKASGVSAVTVLSFAKG